MPAAIEALVLLEPSPPETSHPERRTVAIDDEDSEAVLDDSPNRIMLLAFNYGPSAVEFASAGSEPRRVEARREFIGLGVGEVTVRVLA